MVEDILTATKERVMIIKKQTKARIGLIGNPSDAFYGKTIAFLFDNFSASCTLWESPVLEIIPNREDRLKFEDIDDLVQDVRRKGYYGGVRLIKATIKKFREYCLREGIKLPRKNFSIEYDTSIPRGVGLGGSSAIITSVLRCLMGFYQVQIPPEIQPNLILSIEKEELNIQAGLQDRVVQVLGGIVYMDFSKEIMERQGYGKYEKLSVPLPDFFLAFRNEGEESGKFHSNLEFRYQRGEREVLKALRELAEITTQAKDALMRRDYSTLGELMDLNFELRRKLVGDEVIGERNLEMIKIARGLGSPAKFSGSGGGVVGLIRDNFEELKKAYRQKGYNIVKVQHRYGRVKSEE